MKNRKFNRQDEGSPKKPAGVLQNFFYRVFCGFVIGLSLIAPGVSGSVMAILMGIYENLLSIMANPFKHLKRNLAWLIPMGIGAAISAVAFIAFFSMLFNQYPMVAALLFLGLIVGNIPAVYDDCKALGFKKSYIPAIVAGFVLSFGFGVLRLYFDTVAQRSSPDALWYLALSGFIGGVVSIVPGVSISTMLLLLGVYNRLLEAAKDSFDQALSVVKFSGNTIDFSSIVVMGVVGLCFLGGMIGFSRVVKHLFTRYKASAYWTVFAFMVGSVAAIVINLPWNEEDFALWQGAISLAVGAIVALGFVWMSRRMRVGENETEMD